MKTKFDRLFKQVMLEAEPVFSGGSNTEVGMGTPDVGASNADANIGSLGPDTTEVKDIEPEDTTPSSTTKDIGKGKKEVTGLKVTIPSFQVVLKGEFQHNPDEDLAVDKTGTYMNIETAQKEIEVVLNKTVGEAMETALKRDGILNNNYRFNNTIGKYAAIFPMEFFFEQIPQTVQKDETEETTETTTKED
jgi:hypothetical protein